MKIMDRDLFIFKNKKINKLNCASIMSAFSWPLAKMLIYIYQILRCTCITWLIWNYLLQAGPDETRLAFIYTCVMCILRQTILEGWANPKIVFGRVDMGTLAGSEGGCRWGRQGSDGGPTNWKELINIIVLIFLFFLWSFSSN